jgi:hypothetical protein
MQLKIVHNHAIDKARWDQTVSQSQKSSVFHYSWVLDLYDTEWHAIIDDTYTFLLPYFVDGKNLTTPEFLPYLGALEYTTFTETIWKQIKQIWNEHYAQGLYRLSKYHRILSTQNQIKKIPFRQIDLVNDYLVIAQQFAPELTEKLSKAARHKLHCSTLRSMNEYIKLSRQQQNKPQRYWDFLHRLIRTSTQLTAGKMYAVHNQNNELIACTFLMFFRNRAYLLHSAFHPEALELHADYLMMNTLMEDLSIYQLSLELHSEHLTSELREHFRYKMHHYFEYRFNNPQNILSLIVQFFKQ